MKNKRFTYYLNQELKKKTKIVLVRVRNWTKEQKQKKYKTGK